MTIQQSNDIIRDAVVAIAEAEMAGVRGAEMITLKRALRVAKEAHARMFRK